MARKIALVSSAALMIAVSVACSKKDGDDNKKSPASETGAVTQNLLAVTTAILPAFEAAAPSLLGDSLTQHEIWVNELKAANTADANARAAVFDLLHVNGSGAANLFDNFKNVGSSLNYMTKSCKTKVNSVVVSPFPFANLGEVKYACKASGSPTVEEMYDAAEESEPAKIEQYCPGMTKAQCVAKMETEMAGKMSDEKRSVAWRIEGKTSNFLFTTEDWEGTTKVTRKVGQGYIGETDALLNFVTHIDYKEGHYNHDGGPYTPRTEIKGNPATGKFALRQYEGSSKAVFGAGLSKGAGNKFLIKTVIGSDEKYFCLDANPTLDTLKNATVLAEADVPTECAGYLTDIDALVPFTSADAPTDAIYREL